MVQWLRICPPRLGTQGQSLVQEDLTCLRITTEAHTSRACEPQLWSPQLPKPMCLEPVFHNKRSHRNEEPARGKKSSPHSAIRESLCAATKTQFTVNKQLIKEKKKKVGPIDWDLCTRKNKK